jgi:hypothetical protein
VAPREGWLVKTIRIMVASRCPRQLALVASIRASKPTRILTPIGLPPDHLPYCMIAYRLQAERLGDLDRDTQRFLD